MHQTYRPHRALSERESAICEDNRALQFDNCGREALTFSTSERLIEKLAQIGAVLCFDLSRSVLTMDSGYQQCWGAVKWRSVFSRSERRLIPER